MRYGVVSVVLGFLVLGSAWAGQPGDDKPGGGKTDLVEEMCSLFASYPTSWREPLLTLAQHPGVTSKLAKKVPVGAATAGQPEDVKKAAQMLAQHPLALQALAADEAGTAAIAKAYAADKAGTLAKIEKQAEIESKATDEWTKRLGQDGDAIDQLSAALKKYQQQNAGLNAEDAAAEAGVSTSAGTINVNALPSPGFSTYVMNNADVYPALSDVMVGQWLGGHNSYAYDHAFHHWWGHFNNAFHDEQFFHNDEHRADRFAEAARYDRHYAHDDHRWEHFNDHRRDFQHLGKVDGPPKGHHQEFGHKPNVAGAGEHHVRHRAEAGRHAAVHRGHANDHQRAHHAAAGHHHAAAHGHSHGGGGHRK